MKTALFKTIIFIIICILIPFFVMGFIWKCISDSFVFGIEKSESLSEYIKTFNP